MRPEVRTKLCDTIRALYDNGWTQQAIVAHVGYSKPTVAALCREMGLAFIKGRRGGGGLQTKRGRAADTPHQRTAAGLDWCDPYKRLAAAILAPLCDRVRHAPDTPLGVLAARQLHTREPPAVGAAIDALGCEVAIERLLCRD